MATNGRTVVARTETRLCFLCDGYWDQLQGGAEYQLYVLAHALLDRGYAVTYVFVDRGTPIRPTALRLRPLVLRSLFRRMFHPYQFLLRGEVRRALDEIQPDFVINRVGNALTGICAKCCIVQEIPMLWQIANISDLLRWRPQVSRTMPFAYIDKKLLDYGIANSTYVMAQARYQDTLLQQRYGRAADLIVKNFHPEETERIEKDQVPLVVWVANLKPKKRPEVFIKLAQEFAQDNHVRFVMAGHLQGNARYHRTIDQLLQTTPNLDYVGELRIEEVNALLRRASVFVNTSDYEGFPNTFVQAWLRRVPVISLHVDPDDVLKSHGLGYHSGSFDGLVSDLRKLLSTPSLRTEIGAHAQRYALAEHGMTTNVDRIADFIERCLVARSENITASSSTFL